MTYYLYGGHANEIAYKIVMSKRLGNAECDLCKRR